MIVVSYLVSIISFYITYMVSALIFGIIILSIKRAFSNPSADLEGLPLSYAAYLSTYSSLFVVLIIFGWFNCEPNWYILTPLMVAVWFFFAPSLYPRQFTSGAAHWGMSLGIISFLFTIS